MTYKAPHQPDATRRECIRAAMEPFDITPEQKEKATNDIMKMLGHFNSHSHDDLTKSKSYLDFFGKAQALVAKFEGDGLTMEKWVKACLKRPALFAQSAENTEAKIRGVVERFADDGLTLANYLDKPYMEPSRFIESPDTIEYNIRTIGERYTKHGISTEAYLKAAIAHPQLFCRAPDTIGKRIDMYFDLQDNGSLQINWHNKERTPRQNLIHMLLNSPSFICGKEEWVLQRLSLALVSGKSLSNAELQRPNPEIADKLSEYVELLDHPLRNWAPANAGEKPDRTIAANSVEYGEMLLVDLARNGALDDSLSAKVLAKIKKGGSETNIRA